MTLFQVSGSASRLRRTCPALSGRGAATSSRRTPPPKAARSSGQQAAPRLPRPPRPVGASHRAEKRREVSRSARRPGWGHADGGHRRRQPGAGWASLPGPEVERRPRPRLRPRPARRPLSPPPPAPLLPAPLPAARAARPLPAERRGACCFLLGMLLGPRSRSLSRRRSSRGAGTRGPGRGRNSAARPTLASSPRAPGSGRAAVRGAPLAWTAAPGAAQEAAAAARAASRPPGCGRSARGLGAEPGVIPGAGRGRSGGRLEGRPAARAPCCRLPAAAVLLAGAPPGAAVGAALRLPLRAESLRAQLSLPLAPRCLGVAASVFSARVAAFSLCAGEADPGCPFPPRT